MKPRILYAYRDRNGFWYALSRSRHLILDPDGIWRREKYNRRYAILSHDKWQIYGLPALRPGEGPVRLEVTRCDNPT